MVGLCINVLVVIGVILFVLYVVVIEDSSFI